MLIERMIRAVKLDPDLYYEVQRDATANKQAFTVMLIVMVCTLIGSGVFVPSPMGLAQAFLCTIGGWIIWTIVAMLVGSQLGGRADFEAILRALGFAHTPGVLYAFNLIPGLHRLLGLVALIWICAASGVALREVLRFDTAKAVQTVLATFVIVAVIDYLTSMTCGIQGVVLAGFGIFR